MLKIWRNAVFSQAVALMHESGLSACLSSSQHQEIVEIIRSLILATDISRQQVKTDILFSRFVLYSPYMIIFSRSLSLSSDIS